MGRSAIFKITVADWRKDIAGAMQVVSGAVGREKVHFQAPDANLIEKEMTHFLEWYNGEEKLIVTLRDVPLSAIRYD